MLGFEGFAFDFSDKNVFSAGNEEVWLHRDRPYAVAVRLAIAAAVTMAGSVPGIAMMAMPARRLPRSGSRFMFLSSAAGMMGFTRRVLRSMFFSFFSEDFVGILGAS